MINIRQYDGPDPKDPTKYIVGLWERYGYEHKIVISKYSIPDNGKQLWGMVHITMEGCLSAGLDESEEFLKHYREMVELAKKLEKEFPEDSEVKK